MDIFDASDDDRELPAWLLGSVSSHDEKSHVIPTCTVLSKLPPEILQAILSLLPAVTLARVGNAARWLDALVRRATLDAVKRCGMCSVPERRLGEGWPCVLRRAELRMATRLTGHLAAGFKLAAWITPAGMPRVLLLGEATELPHEWCPVPPLPSRRALAVACGSFHALVLFEDGCVVCIESHTNGMQWRQMRRGAAEGEEAVVAVAAGAFHSLLVGGCGSLWSSGRGGHGELGLGPHVSFAPEPAQVPFHAKALQASGGGFHSLVLTHGGMVCSFGCGADGRLGLGDAFSRHTPCTVPLPGGACA